MNDRPWSPFHKHFRVLKPPLEATPETAAAIDEAIREHRGRALLLGVTPRLSDLADDTTALDWSGAMVARVWPGDTGQRRAIEADWRAMPFSAPQFTTVIGDGSFNCLTFPADYSTVFAELERILMPGARFALRYYLTPDPCEDFAAIRESALGGKILAIDALKWRLGMAVASRSGANVARGQIYDAFDTTFRDRAALLSATGWDESELAAVDWYKGVGDTISFPSARELLDIVPASFVNAHFVSSGTYELAERCPVLVMDVRP